MIKRFRSRTLLLATAHHKHTSHCICKISEDKVQIIKTPSHQPSIILFSNRSFICSALVVTIQPLFLLAALAHKTNKTNDQISVRNIIRIDECHGQLVVGSSLGWRRGTTLVGDLSSDTVKVPVTLCCQTSTTVGVLLYKLETLKSLERLACNRA